MFSIKELKQLLEQLDYDEIEFAGYGDYNNVVYFDALIDTHYRIMCLPQSDGSIEIHDTTFDVDNYVLIARVCKKNNHWVIKQ